MKMKPDDYARLEAAMLPLMQEFPWRIGSELRMPPKMWRWGLVEDGGLMPWLDGLGLTEGEIDAALRKITRG